MSTVQMLGLGGVILVAAMSPGPDFFIVTRSSALSGRRAGMACAAGIAGGVFLWSVVSALGVAGLLAASAVAFTIVKLLGAGYLMLLGVRALLAARRGGYEATADLPADGPSAAAAFRQGLLTNLLNPKVAVFFLALLPQFVPAEPAVTDTISLGAVAALVSLTWFTVLANVVGALRGLLARASVRRAIDTVMGTLLVAFGVRIVLQSN
ncbi:threonine/homoserine/homoserine lactone efflux protein [Nocardia tenerifensis]|uniref:Threonine/homoserine/homoserine lactone efflux protein n=1 Tax=Nocardia tenerifensis TaxID=228006 RepID=A0A318JS84_9NOCA|nr:LysE family translocator [Nocardia tenerifensis]PXX54799.1 threonine/homoserine/homoserine lactone efflux protein [Nocardia tenerifensis]